MTEYWKSNKMHWCDICKCWLNDTKAAILHHERGNGHQDNLKRKLHDMTKKADDDKRTKAHVERSINKMEEAAEKRYKADLEAAEQETGRWSWDEGSKYYYNAKFRWYFDPKTQWYYGGNPPDWTQAPAALPDTAKYGSAPSDGGPLAAPSGTPSTSSQPSSTPAPSSGPPAPAAAASRPAGKVVHKVLALPSHPQASVGGSKGPTVGRVGAAKGLMDVSGTSASAGAAEVAKRKREADKAAAAPVSAAESEAVARREAARQRVANREAQGYGFM